MFIFSYKQLKFNLLREESEGYSKLITELINSGDSVTAKALSRRLLKLIGMLVSFLLVFLHNLIRFGVGACTLTFI